MSDPGKFGAQKPPENIPKMDCAAFEQLLADAVENALPPETAAPFAAHAESCAICRERLAQARQGHDWLHLLKLETIEPSAGLVDAILARTSGLAAPSTLSTNLYPELPEHADATHAVAPPQSDIAVRRLWKRSALPSLATLRHTAMEPRLALTAAMAFFSISLTLSLLGVHLGGLRAADLAPQNLRRTMTRQYAQANSRVVRYYENLRFVYEVESRVQELRRAAETPEPAGQHPKQEQGKSSSSNDLEPHRGPLARTPGTSGKHPPSSVHDLTVQVLLGPLVDAALRLPENAQEKNLQATLCGKIYMTTVSSSLPISQDAHWPTPERSAI